MTNTNPKNVVKCTCGHRKWQHVALMKECIVPSCNCPKLNVGKYKPYDPKRKPKRNPKDTGEK